MRAWEGRKSEVPGELSGGAGSRGVVMRELVRFVGGERKRLIRYITTEEEEEEPEPEPEERRVRGRGRRRADGEGAAGEQGTQETGNPAARHRLYAAPHRPLSTPSPLQLRLQTPPSRRVYSSSSPHPPAAGDAIFDTTPRAAADSPPAPQHRLPHLTPSGSAHMVSVASKPSTARTAIAAGRVLFSNPAPLRLIRANALKKGDVLAVARVAGIMAAKKCPELVPLCHPILLAHVGVEVGVVGGGVERDGGQGAGEGGRFGAVLVEAKVQCVGATGVEMEALTAVMGAALTVVDMCKAVDRGMRVEGVRVVLKEGGRSGTWREEEWRSCVGEGNREAGQ